jgi:hypothetical protein
MFTFPLSGLGNRPAFFVPKARVFGQTNGMEVLGGEHVVVLNIVHIRSIYKMIHK